MRVRVGQTEGHGKGMNIYGGPAGCQALAKHIALTMASLSGGVLLHWSLLICAH